jgi:thioredoxin domain-containing protein 5
VDGFPTIFLYQDGTKISEYNGSRSLEDLYQFVAKYLAEDKPKDEL